MNVRELREALATMPDHWPVHVETEADGSGGGADTEFLFTLECVPSSFPTYGNFALVRINPEPQK